MALQIDVTGNIETIKRSLYATEVQVSIATTRALNKTAMWVRTRAVRDISSKAKVPQKIVRERLKLTRASKANLEATLHIGRRDASVQARKIGTIRQTRRGAAVKQHLFEGAFAATMPGGSEGIYKRKTEARLPIKEMRISLYQPSNEVMDNLIDSSIKERFDTLFERELNYITR